MYSATIDIATATVLKNVRRLANYTGDRMPADSEAFDRIALEEVSNDVLEPILEGAISEVSRVLRYFVTSVTETTSGYSMVLSLPNAGDELVRSLEYAMFRFFEYAVLSGWYDIANRGDSENTKAKAVSYMERLKAIANYRSRPSKAHVTPEVYPWKDIVIEGTDTTSTEETE